MNAQKSWKQAYRRMHGSKDYFDRSNAFGAMQRFRREAALERRIEAQQRRIEELQDRVWQLEAKIPNYDDGVRISSMTPEQVAEHYSKWIR